MVVKQENKEIQSPLRFQVNLIFQSGVKYEAKLLPSGEIIFTPEELGQQVSYVSDDAFDLNLDKIFDEYDDVFKALVEK